MEWFAEQSAVSCIRARARVGDMRSQCSGHLEPCGEERFVAFVFLL